MAKRKSRGSNGNGSRGRSGQKRKAREDKKGSGDLRSRASNACTESNVRAAMEVLQGLDPKPGSRFTVEDRARLKLCSPGGKFKLSYGVATEAIAKAKKRMATVQSESTGG